MKVFSKEKYLEREKELEVPKAIIEMSLETWVNECDGLTEEEMYEEGYVTDDNWMVEKGE